MGQVKASDMPRSEGIEDLEGAQLAILKSKLAFRNLSDFVADDETSTAEIDEALQKLSQARLDRERITALQPSLFHCLPHLSSLYLQQNELKSLRGIEEAKQLQFLTVAGNQLAAIEGLKKLQKLLFLDVSRNAINKICVDEELPEGLSFLNVTDNPCCERQDGLMNFLIECLPNLKEIDGVRLAAINGSCGLHPFCEGAIESEDTFLAANETFLEELDEALSGHPHESLEVSQTKSKNVPALPADAVQSLFDTKSKLLHTSFEEILQRSRARIQQDQQNGEKIDLPEQIYQQGDVRARLQHFLSASSLAKELEDLEERPIYKSANALGEC